MATPYPHAPTSPERHVRRRIERVFVAMCGVGLLATALAVSPGVARATTFNVVNTNDSGAGSLRAAVADANGNSGLDTITFDPSLSDSTITLTFGEVIITDDVIIDGSAAPDLIISAGGSDRAIGAYGGDVELRSLTVRDGESTFPGGVVFVDADLTLVASEISHSSSTVEGGGAYVTGDLDMSNSTITENSAPTGGGLRVLGQASIDKGSTLSGNSSDFDGGAIAVDDGRLTVTDSDISENDGCASDGDGGAVYAEGPVTINNSTISGNSCGGGDGGGIFVESEAVLLPVVRIEEASVVAGNGARHAGGIGVDSVSLIVSDSSFTDNVAAGAGGAIEAHDSDLDVSSSTIRDNAADSGGGVHHTTGSITLTDSNVNRNTATDNGGGVRTVDSVIEIADGSISENSAEDGSGLWAAAGESVAITGTVVRENNADEEGGGLFIVNFPTATVTTVQVGQNTAGERGAGVYISNVAALELSGVSIDANGQSQFGGGLYALDIDDLAIQDSNIMANQADEQGGGVWIEDGGAATIENSTIAGNKAVGGSPDDVEGGGIFVREQTAFTLIDTVIEDNESVGLGGGVSIGDVEQVSIDGGRVDGNTAAFAAGAAVRNALVVSVSGVTIAENAATANVGGLGVINTLQTLVEDITVLENTAPFAAGVALSSLPDVTISGSTVRGNVSSSDDEDETTDGGGIYSVESQLRVASSTIAGNTAGRGGGIMAVFGSLDIVDATTIDDNVADTGGGIATIDAELTTSRAVVFSNNRAMDGDGGGASISDESSTISETSFIGNSAVGDGGGLRSNSTVTIETSTFSDNSATGSGGGARVTSALVSRSVMSGNSAGVDGGGLYAVAGIGVTSSTFHRNSAEGAGGAIGVGGDEETGAASFSFLTVTENSAGVSGGGIQAGPAGINQSTRVITTNNTAPRNPDIAFPFAPEWSIVGDLGDTPAVNRIGRSALGLVTGIDPLLGPLADNGGPTQTRVPSPRSQAIDAGGAITDDLVDQRGTVIAQGETLDIGAVTYDGPVPVWTPVTPARLVDTRSSGETVDGTFRGAGTIDAGDTLRVAISGRGDVPASAVGAIINVTAINPERVGFITVYACTDTLPNASSLNYTTGVNLPNEVVAGLNDDGDVCIFSSARTQLAVDVVGFLAAPSPFEAVGPARLLDTRQTGATIDGESRAGGRSPARSEVTVRVAGRAEIPDDAVAAVVNVVAIGPSGTGFVTVHACLDDRPLTSSLNYVAGGNRGNEILAGLSDDGEICVFTSRDSHLVVDVVGYLGAGLDVTAVAPARVFETRANTPTVDGEFEGAGRLDAGSVIRVQLTGRAEVPIDATTVNINVTAINAERNGFLTIFPCGERPLAASLNYVPNVNGGNDLISGLDSDGGLCVFTSSATDLTIDIAGYTTL